MKAILTYENASCRILDTENDLHIHTEENVTTVRIPRYLFRGEKIATVDITSVFPSASVGDEGWMLSVQGELVNTALMYYREREDFTFSNAAVMPVMG